MKKTMTTKRKVKKNAPFARPCQRAGLKSDDRGMTMVEVLMGFVLLLLMLGMLSGIIALSSNMLMRSVDLKQAEEALQKEIYKTSLTGSPAVPVSGPLSLVPETGTGGAIGLPSAKLYQLSTGDLLTDEAQKESLTMTFYYIK